MNRIASFVLGLVLISSIQSGFAQAKNQKLSGQSFSGAITVNASPEQVWSVLTDATTFTKIMGYEYQGGSKKFSQVGAQARVKVWGDDSNFTLTRATSGKELRFNLDPANGSYICSCRWKLAKSGNGTKVWFEERYTESAPQSQADLDAQVKDTNEMLRRLKIAAEKR